MNLIYCLADNASWISIIHDEHGCEMENKADCNKADCERLHLSHSEGSYDVCRKSTMSLFIMDIGPSSTERFPHLSRYLRCLCIHAIVEFY